MKLFIFTSIFYSYSLTLYCFHLSITKYVKNILYGSSPFISLSISSISDDLIVSVSSFDAILFGYLPSDSFSHSFLQCYLSSFSETISISVKSSSSKSIKKPSVQVRFWFMFYVISIFVNFFNSYNALFKYIWIILLN